MEESYSARPLVGRWLALDLRPTRPLTLLGPAWAALCGVLASGAFTLRGQAFVTLVFSILLCDTLLGAWRALWLQPEWRESLRRNPISSTTWLSFSDDATVWLPLRWLNRLSRRWLYLRSVVWPRVDSVVIGMTMAGVLALSVAAVLGQLPFIFTIVAMLLALAEGQVPAVLRSELGALAEIAMPWFIAETAFGSFAWLSLLFVLLFVVVYRALVGLVLERRERWMLWSNAAQGIAALVLVFINAPAGAGVIALGLLAQVLWQIRYRTDQDGRTYAQQVQSYVLVAMMVTGLSLWL